MSVPVRFVAVSLLVLSLGLHWALLQTVAWTGMLINYSRHGTLMEAVAKTFDGKHPCKLCLAINQCRAEEQKQDHQQVKPGSKLEFGLIWTPIEFQFAHDRLPLPSLDFPLRSRAEEPPKPRPRRVDDNHARA